MSEKSSFSIKKYLLISSLSSAFVTAIIWICFLSYVFGPDYFINKSFPHKYVINSTEAVNNSPRCLTEIGHLVSQGVIVDAKEIWTFQGDFYAALITILIALLALLGAVAFFYIRTVSLDKVQEFANASAKEATNNAINSFEFIQSINDKIEDKVALIGEDSDVIDEHIAEINKRLETIEAILSSHDRSDDVGSNLTLGPSSSKKDVGDE